MLSSTDWPGKRLGLPESGSRSIARVGVRLAAFAIDWALAYVIAMAFFEGDGFVMMSIYAVMQIAMIATAGGSIGHLIMRMRVVRLDGRYNGVLRPALRTLLICVVIPAVIWDSDQRGMHDRLAGTVLVRV
ncbi:RDD family protein [Klugiella sp. YN-L-19]|uniref:RDD family protein n=2 Tax=Ruicaihuangia caeni TaxID=3042517 RepID=A0AAW6T6M8_9MICO|nr:RDD family protein [Klugiella sp. YN-L-19]MDI2098008.1 RDD family protein [Klugiella sp. YN-L-19]